jgi:hypothetical protein
MCIWQLDSDFVSIALSIATKLSYFSQIEKDFITIFLMFPGLCRRLVYTDISSSGVARCECFPPTCCGTKGVHGEFKLTLFEAVKSLLESVMKESKKIIKDP